jgi:hypothetical protein
MDNCVTLLSIVFSATEPFHFNEEFDWAWAQGRDGFGPYGKFRPDPNNINSRPLKSEDAPSEASVR